MRFGQTLVNLGDAMQDLLTAEGRRERARRRRDYLRKAAILEELMQSEGWAIFASIAKDKIDQAELQVLNLLPMPTRHDPTGRNCAVQREYLVAQLQGMKQILELPAAIVEHAISTANITREGLAGLRRGSPDEEETDQKGPWEEER
jgi:hypothetical protein